ncbi:MAG: hypothetical protein ACXADW_05025 [Candidatus Hodarchaeales archaeon]|jgi:hypothetical protein
MTIGNRLTSLCFPAQVYFIISIISILGILSQNAMDSDRYRIGIYSAKSPIKNIWFFTFKIIGVLLWTFMLNFLCDSGLKGVAWFFVLLPIVLMFVIIGAVMLILLGKQQSRRERIAAIKKRKKTKH